MIYLNREYCLAECRRLSSLERDRSMRNRKVSYHSKEIDHWCRFLFFSRLILCRNIANLLKRLSAWSYSQFIGISMNYRWFYAPLGLLTFIFSIFFFFFLLWCVDLIVPICPNLFSFHLNSDNQEIMNWGVKMILYFRVRMFSLAWSI